MKQPGLRTVVQLQLLNCANLTRICIAGNVSLDKRIRFFFCYTAGVGRYKFKLVLAGESF